MRKFCAEQYWGKVGMGGGEARHDRWGNIPTLVNLGGGRIAMQVETFLPDCPTVATRSLYDILEEMRQWRNRSFQ